MINATCLPQVIRTVIRKTQNGTHFGPNGVQCADEREMSEHDGEADLHFETQEGIAEASAT